MAQQMTAEMNRDPSLAEEARLLKDAAQTGSRYADARRRLREHWVVAKDDLAHFSQRAADYSQSAARVTNAYAHDHPWRTAGAAIGVGALLGWLLTRR